MAKKKTGSKKKHHPGLPQGMTLADVLALKRNATEAVISNAKDAHQKVLGDRQAQRMEWVDNVVLSEHFGFTPEMLDDLRRFRTVELALYAKQKADGDQDFADEKLRIRASNACRRELTYAHDNLPLNMDVPTEGFDVLREAEGRLR